MHVFPWPFHLRLDRSSVFPAAIRTAGTAGLDQGGTWLGATMRRILFLLLCAELSFGAVSAAEAAKLPAMQGEPSTPSQHVLTKRAPSWVFAVHRPTRSIIRVLVTGGPVTRVAATKTAWAVNSVGDVYVVDNKAKRVTRVPADGSTARSVGSGFTDPTDVQLDAAGRVYVVDGTRVVRLTAAGGAQKVVAAPVSSAVFVAPDGAVSTASGDFDVKVRTYPSDGRRVIERTIGGQSYFVPGRGELLGDGAGNLFLHIYDTGGSGFRWWVRVPSGSSKGTPLYTRWAYYAVAVDSRSRFHLAQTADFCGEPDEATGTCAPDLSVHEILSYARDGKRTSRRIQPFTLERTNNGAGTLVVDGQGRMFVAQGDGPSTGLLMYGPRGGGPTHLASGAFSEPKRNS